MADICECRPGDGPGTVSRWPDDPTAYRPSVRWLGIIVVLVMVAIFAVIGGLLWMSVHHNAFEAQLTGQWAARAGTSAVTLTVAPETKTYTYSATNVVTRETGALLVTGSITGRQVSGRIVMHGFPPWGSSVQTTLLGKPWTLSSQDSGRRLVLVSQSGQTTTLSQAP